MATIRQKLNSRRGTSVLIAMILFLVATMVSATIVSASLTATKRAKSEQEHTQNMLYIQSAVRLVNKLLENTKFTVVKDAYTDGSPTPVWSYENLEADSLMGASVRAATENGTSQDVQFKIEAEGMPDVTFRFTMQPLVGSFEIDGEVWRGEADSGVRMIESYQAYAKLTGGSQPVVDEPIYRTVTDEDGNETEEEIGRHRQYKMYVDGWHSTITLYDTQEGGAP